MSRTSSHPGHTLSRFMGVPHDTGQIDVDGRSFRVGFYPPCIGNHTGTGVRVGYYCPSLLSQTTAQRCDDHEATLEYSTIIVFVTPYFFIKHPTDAAWKLKPSWPVYVYFQCKRSGS